MMCEIKPHKLNLKYEFTDSGILRIIDDTSTIKANYELTEGQISIYLKGSKMPAKGKVIRFSENKFTIAMEEGFFNIPGPIMFFEKRISKK
jgi:hypothetical protein